MCRLDGLSTCLLSHVCWLCYILMLGMQLTAWACMGNACVLHTSMPPLLPPPPPPRCTHVRTAADKVQEQGDTSR